MSTYVLYIDTLVALLSKIAMKRIPVTSQISIPDKVSSLHIKLNAYKGVKAIVKIVLRWLRPPKMALSDTQIIFFLETKYAKARKMCDPHYLLPSEGRRGKGMREANEL